MEHGKNVVELIPERFISPRPRPVPLSEQPCAYPDVSLQMEANGAINLYKPRCLANLRHGKPRTIQLKM